MNNSAEVLERFKQNAPGACSALYLRVLKSDLDKLLRQYMSLDEIDLSVKPFADGYKLNIAIDVSEFKELGK